MVMMVMLKLMLDVLVNYYGDQAGAGHRRRSDTRQGRRQAAEKM